MVKASAPLFVLISAYIFGIEKITWSLVGIVLVIIVGELLTVAGELEFDMVGFLLCLGATIMSGLRWTTVQFTLQNLDPKIETALEAMRLLSPFMSISMFLLSMVIERPWVSLFGGDEGKNYLEDADTIWKTIGISIIGGVLAVSMVMCEFWLIVRTNAIIMMIAGVSKELINIFIGVSLFNDSLTWMDILGCTIVFSGVILYKVTYHLNKKKEEQDGDVEEGMEKDDSYQVVELKDGIKNVQMVESTETFNAVSVDESETESDNLLQ
eukprot:CAMPEP_0172490508 /NCGR_PEP_ID=MMETSP1066-20121228/20952_1 /TAXON_ID=671091 /ORGANISM="Coscinodiscus wailesii, Strain CCMP2513" /LENGTH=267 /DNA_ID=CAMNT_0013259003 /DNA_START=472 /DNA_END=1275 /DNA_ORIENTATION=-